MAEAGFVIERGVERKFLCTRGKAWFWKANEDEAFKFPLEAQALHAMSLLAEQFTGMTVKQFKAA